jgi:hypothetical protein
MYKKKGVFMNHLDPINTYEGGFKRREMSVFLLMRSEGDQGLGVRSQLQRAMPYNLTWDCLD